MSPSFFKSEKSFHEKSAFWHAAKSCAANIKSPIEAKNEFLSTEYKESQVAIYWALDGSVQRVV